MSLFFAFRDSVMFYQHDTCGLGNFYIHRCAGTHVSRRGCAATVMARWAWQMRSQVDLKLTTSAFDVELYI